MKTYNCIIVDDESLAQDLIETHLTKISNINIVSKCHTAMEALQALNEHSIDIMFLDIEMPDLTGIEFLKSLNRSPYTIFTTAYSEFALESYELNVVDYLLKPVRFDRFFKAINKVLSLLKGNESEDESTHINNVSDDYIFVKSDYKAVKIHFNDIVFVESMQKYVKFHLTGKMVTTLMSISSLVDILPSAEFFRCQKSFIVNLTKIEGINGNQLIMGSGIIVPISKNLKHELIKRIDKNKLL
ncbi:MAG: response regulator transcription factor [Bacteroidetes bacterium]|jgi:DNA-binding LytR/AlgR family response regulator|nr:response regulator transcription factor [Bacteroidota bacterium]MBT6685191.1 response regulator transcription factor [Bacteroidota bacterium]MBT7143448.1 response regulator transcription factor [Bacteroidota bacterium]MBT7492044.1 response regulator transcription factor [Bacteroidota bacterium]